jgi:hypothetical protein
MKGNKKSSRLGLLELKVSTIIQVLQKSIDDQAYLKELAVGTLETIKMMPDYEEAIDKLKEKNVEDKKIEL